MLIYVIDIVNKILLQNIKKPFMGNADKKNIQLTEKEWQIVLDSLSNTIFNEEITEEARKNAKELYLKINKNV
jgi:hypothetical protein